MLYLLSKQCSVVNIQYPLVKKYILVLIVLLIALAGLLIFLSHGKEIYIGSGGQPSTSRAYFSANSQISIQIADAINSSQKTIDLALYEFTSENLRNTLNTARDRGVDIRIVADTLQASDKNTIIPELIKDGHNVRLLSGRQNQQYQGSMHHKFAIFDRKLLEFGSYNWTYFADNLNYENAVFTSDPVLISAYQSEFDRLWNQ